MRPDYYKAAVKVNVPGRQEKVLAQLECFDLIDALGGDFYMGNAIKYVFRAGRKVDNRREDLAKAITYLRQVMKRDERMEKVD